jgi:hypothetical protein
MAVISLDIHVEDLPSVLALFDRIQVWRCPTELGTYAEITAPDELPARLEGVTPGPWAVSGTDLIITLNSADPITITFTGTNPLNLTSVCQQINALIPALATEVAPGTNRLALTSPVEGTGSSLIVSGGAATLFGLPTTKANGKAARIPVIDPTTDYLFRDFDGESTYWYKTRYYSTTTHSVSSFSDARQGNPQQVLPVGVMTQATISLSDGAGRPVSNRRVIFIPVTIQRAMSGSKNYGILPGQERLVMTTDMAGYGEINLVRGQTYKVFFDGAAYEREFVAPNVASFDVLDAIATSPDPFSVVQVPPMPIRSS